MYWTGLQDKSGTLCLEHKAKATDANVATMQTDFQSCLDATLNDTDVDLSGLTISMPSSNGSQLVIGTGTTAAGEACRNGKGKLKFSGLTAGPAAHAVLDASCGVPALDKALRGTRDPIAAASKARKFSLKDFNNMLVKLEKAETACLSALGEKNKPEKPENIAFIDESEAVETAIKNINNRFLMIHKLSTRLAVEKPANEQVCQEVLQMCKKDEYFKERAISLQSLQTVGFMHRCRNDWDLLDSPDAVKREAAIHHFAVETLKELCDGALTAATQYKARNAAVLNAKKAEEAAVEKENKRLELQKKKDQAKADKAEKAAAERQRKADEKAAAKKKEAEAANKSGEEDQEENDGQKCHRRGKGIGELGDDDPYILRTKIPDADCTIAASLQEFAETAARGSPCVWRLKRSVAKKIMEGHSEVLGDSGPCRKEINSVNTMMKVENANFMTAFHEKVEVWCGSQRSTVTNVY